MKRIISLCLVFTFVVGILQISAHADGEMPVTPSSHNITVYYPEDLPQDIQDKILAHFYGLEAPGDDQENILCTLFGHKLTETTTTVITHNVYANAPRCLREDYNLSVCSRCDYVNQELIASHRIYCH